MTDENIWIALFLSFTKVKAEALILIMNIIRTVQNNIIEKINYLFEKIFQKPISDFINISELQNFIMENLQNSGFEFKDIIGIVILIATIIYLKTEHEKSVKRVQFFYKQKLGELKEEIGKQDKIFRYTIHGLYKTERQSVDLNLHMFAQLRSTEKALIKLYDKRSLKNDKVLKKGSCSKKEGKNSLNIDGDKMFPGSLSINKIDCGIVKNGNKVVGDKKDTGDCKINGDKKPVGNMNAVDNKGIGDNDNNTVGDYKMVGKNQIVANNNVADNENSGESCSGSSGLGDVSV